MHEIIASAFKLVWIVLLILIIVSIF